MAAHTSETMLLDDVAEFADPRLLEAASERILGEGSHSALRHLALRSPSETTSLAALEQLLSVVPPDHTDLRVLAGSRETPALVQRRLAGVSPDLAFRLAHHTTDHAVVAQILSGARLPMPSEIYVEGTDQPKEEAKRHAAALRLLRRAATESTTESTTENTTGGDAVGEPELASVLTRAGAHEWGLRVIAAAGRVAAKAGQRERHPDGARDVVVFWGAACSDAQHGEIEAAVLASGSRHLVGTAACLARTSDRLRDQLLDWACAELAGATFPSPSPIVGYVYRSAKWFSPSQTVRLKAAVRSCPDLTHLPHREWLRQLTTSDERESLPQDPDHWSSMPIDEVLPLLERLQHRLPSVVAARALAQRRDVETAAATLLARSNNHTDKAWLGVRVWDQHFTFELLTRNPGWVTLEAHGEIAVKLLEFAVDNGRGGTQFEALATRLAPALARDDFLSMRWETLRQHRKHDPEAARAFADELATLVGDPLLTKTLLVVLGTDAGRSMTTSEVFDVVRGSHT